jgi:hypothetical protein
MAGKAYLDTILNDMQEELNMEPFSALSCALTNVPPRLKKTLSLNLPAAIIFIQTGKLTSYKDFFIDFFTKESLLQQLKFVIFVLTKCF